MFALLFEERYIVSSANRETRDLSITGMPLAYIKYKNGARYESCGTPAFMSQ